MATATTNTFSEQAVTELLIDRLGHLGDGVATTGDGRLLFVPFALAGETVDVAINGNNAASNSVVTPSPDRIEPECRHFGTCGGCVLQHLAPAPYAAFKRQLVVDALADRGPDARGRRSPRRAAAFAPPRHLCRRDGRPPSAGRLQRARQPSSRDDRRVCSAETRAAGRPSGAHCPHWSHCAAQGRARFSPSR